MSPSSSMMPEYLLPRSPCFGSCSEASSAASVSPSDFLSFSFPSVLPASSAEVFSLSLASSASFSSVLVSASASASSASDSRSIVSSVGVSSMTLAPAFTSLLLSASLLILLFCAAAYTTSSLTIKAETSSATSILPCSAI